MDTLNDSPTYLILKSSLFCFAFILGTFGNCLVVYATLRYTSLRTPTNVLVCNMCVVDVLTIVTGLPSFILTDYFDTHRCTVLEPLLTVFVSANVFTLSAIAIERYLIVLPRIPITVNKSLAVAVCIDIVSCLTGLPLLLSARQDTTCSSIWSERSCLVYAYLMFIVQYIAPLVLMTVLYLRIWYVIRKKNRKSIRIFNKNRLSTMSSQFRNEDDFVSESTNHLATKRSINRRRSSSLNALQRKEPAQSLTRSTSFQTPSLRRSCYDVGSRNSLRSGDSRNGQLRRSGSLRGSVKRLHRSLTSVITGMEFAESTRALISARRFKQTKQTLRVFATLLTVFALSILLYQIDHLLFGALINPLYRSLLLAPLYINVTINPLLYGAMNPKFLEAFKRIFSPRERGIHKLMKRKFFTTEENERKESECNQTFFTEERKSSVFDDKCSESEDEQTGFKSLSQIFRRTSSRYSQRNSPRKAERVSEDVMIPLNAPIIIITSYDDDMNCPFL